MQLPLCVCAITWLAFPTPFPPLPLPPAPQQAKPAGAAAAIGMQINFGSDERMTAQQE